MFPDSYTIYNGSMYSNSPTTGNWETYITEDLISYIDSHYRTIANRESRASPVTPWAATERCASP